MLEDRPWCQEQPRAGEVDESVFEFAVRRSQLLMDAQPAAEADEVIHLGPYVRDLHADVPKPSVHRRLPWCTRCVTGGAAYSPDSASVADCNSSPHHPARRTAYVRH